VGIDKNGGIQERSMVKNIHFKDNEIKEITNKKFGLLGIRFTDDQENEYEWWPK
jgi:hypothetical protein